MAQTSDMVVETEIQALTSLGEHLIDSIIADEPIETIKAIIDSDAPLWYQNSAEGMSPLHASAYMQNAELARILIERGALWNAVDNLKNTAGDISLSLNDLQTYNIIRDAGIRAELLLSLLSSKASIESSSSLILREADLSAAGSTETFLSSKLKYTQDTHGQDICLLKVGEEEIGVMMGWEQEIMEDTVRKLCDGHHNTQKLKVLNIGFGLGIIDSLFQSLPTRPIEHVIIEPHPDVLQHMKDRGWHEKPGVTILEGKWQDLLESDAILGAGGFDVIYTDTFSEDYGELRQFFEHLPDLLAGPESRFSFFNGLGATNALFYDVYTHIAELHLADVGIDIKWFDIDVTFDVKEGRWGDSRKYFSLPLYRLPVGSMTSTMQVSS
ncbi:S-adenosyl-L-methionine-dependent methyltransferase [Lyophyllum atratum]|nr:S-adenosyl-L-methionine-dependent methyltransferase [Lyophyllum atratum]